MTQCLYMHVTTCSCLQAANANALQKRLSGSANSFQIIGSEEDPTALQNLVQLGPLLRITADATCEPAGPNRTSVNISEVAAQLGPLK